MIYALDQIYCDAESCNAYGRRWPTLARMRWTVRDAVILLLERDAMFVDAPELVTHDAKKAFGMTLEEARLPDGVIWYYQGVDLIGIRDGEELEVATHRGFQFGQGKGWRVDDYPRDRDDDSAGFP